MESMDYMVFVVVFGLFASILFVGALFLDYLDEIRG